MKKRIEWIDILKGITIIFVVIGHNLESGSVLFNYIYSFHMPLFFFMSGYVFDIRKNSDFKEFFVKKAKTILMPYFYFAIISVIIYSIYI